MISLKSSEWLQVDCEGNLVTKPQTSQKMTSTSPQCILCRSMTWIHGNEAWLWGRTPSHLDQQGICSREPIVRSHGEDMWRMEDCRTVVNRSHSHLNNAIVKDGCHTDFLDSTIEALVSIFGPSRPLSWWITTAQVGWRYGHLQQVESAFPRLVNECEQDQFPKDTLQSRGTDANDSKDSKYTSVGQMADQHSFRVNETDLFKSGC